MSAEPGIRLACSLAAVLSLMLGLSGASAPAKTVPGDPTYRLRAADRALAQRMALRRADLPGGWRSGTRERPARASALPALLPAEAVRPDRHRLLRLAGVLARRDRLRLLGR